MPQELQLGLVLLISALCRVVQPLDCNCNQTVLPPATSPNHEEVELLLNCSLNYLSITTIFKIPWEELTYTIFYTCVHLDHSQPMQHVAICNALKNKTKSLNERIPCGSFCTFGGCYSSGPLGRVVNYRIPQQSCFVCNDDSGVCPSKLEHNGTCGRQCTPSLNLGSGTVHCNCSVEEDCPSTNNPGIDSTLAVGSSTMPPGSTTAVGSGMVPPDSTTAVDETSLSLSKCAVLSQGHSCECFSTYPNSSLLYCSNVSGCDNICDVGLSNCTYTEYINDCICTEKNCTSDKRTVPIIVTVTPILIASILITLCLVIVLCFVTSKNRRRKETRPDFMESKVFDETFAFDPVDVAVPLPYQFDDALSGSFSTLLHSFDTLSLEKQLRTASALSNHNESYMDSECHLSDAEGYIVCRDCPDSSCSEIKMCHHCQISKDEKS